MAERKILGDAIHVGLVHRGGATQVAAALGALGLRQMAFAGACAHHFSAGRDFESFGHGLLGLYTFWTSHKINQVTFKKSAQYRELARAAQGIIFATAVVSIGLERLI
jgi:hypothetical protein